jgi:WD40 repeat protein
MWDPKSGQPTRSLQGHTGPVMSICTFKMDNEDRLASASADGTVRIWDPATQRRLRTLGDSAAGFNGFNGVTTFTLNDQILLIAARDDHTVLVWDAKTGENIHTFRGHTGAVTSLCTFTRDGTPVLASTSKDRTVRTWDLEKMTSRYVIPVHHLATGSTWSGDSLVISLKAGLLALSTR